MEFIEERLPDQNDCQSERGKFKHITAMLDEFKHSGAQSARVAFDSGEYCSILSARCNLLKAAKNMGFDIRTVVRNGALYLIKKDQ